MTNQTSALSPPGRVPVRQITPSIDPFAPLFGQNTFFERLRYCFSISNPLLLFVPRTELQRASCIVSEMRNKGMLPPCITSKDIASAQLLYESSYNQSSGRIIPKIYRMSALAPMNALFLGTILTFYKSPSTITLTNGLYHGFAALRSYKNGCSSSNVNLGNVLLSFLTGTGASIISMLYLNNYLRCSPPIFGRFVPLIATMAGTIIGTPLLYINYLVDGVPVYDNHNHYLGLSKKIGFSTLFIPTLSRIAMFLPGMAISPFIIQHLCNRGSICRYPWSVLPINIALMFGFLTLSIPLSCTLFKNKTTIPINQLECCIQKRAKKCCANSAYTFTCM